MYVVLISLLTGVIFVSLNFYLFKRDITALNILTSSFQEKESSLITLKSMEEYTIKAKELIDEYKGRVFSEPDIFLKNLPKLISDKGLLINSINIGEESTTSLEDSSFSYITINLSLKGSENSLLSMLDYLENKLEKEVRVSSLNITRETSNLLQIELNLIIIIFRE